VLPTNLTRFHQVTHSHEALYQQFLAGITVLGHGFSPPPANRVCSVLRQAGHRHQARRQEIHLPG